jgi:hypothetical protein
MSCGCEDRNEVVEKRGESGKEKSASLSDEDGWDSKGRGSVRREAKR